MILKFVLTRLIQWAWLICSLAPAALAQVTEVQHALDFPLHLREGWELTLHARVRSQPGGLGFMQERAGVVLEHSLTARVSILGGYMFDHQKTARDWRGGGQRPFLGLQGTLWARKRLVVDGRSVMERYMNVGSPSYTRSRDRLRMSWNAKLSPYGGVELFLDSHGWRGTRYSTGMRWRINGYVDVDLGYYLEPRRQDTGALRHMWQTGVRVRNVHLRHRGRLPDIPSGD